MNALRCLFLAVLVGALAGCASLFESDSYTGYVEGDFILVGPDESGRLETLSVHEGDDVADGAPLFTLESKTERAVLAAARAKLIEAEAALALSEVGLERAKKLLKRGVVAQSRLDDARAAFDRDTATVNAAKADIDSAETRLTRRAISSPVTGMVQEVFFRTGEVVAAGRPVVSLLPPGNLKIRFYVPEPDRPLVRAGTMVDVACDGCKGGLTARVYFVSGEAEYAPPVIFSREERSKLLYLVEARPGGEAARLPIGQPVTVTLADERQAASP